MGQQERERKARQKARTAEGGEAGGGAKGGRAGDAPQSQNKLAIFPDDPSRGEIGRDARLLSRAINQRWPIDPDKMGKIVDKLFHSLDACTGEEKKEVAALARVAVQMVGQNQRDDLSLVEPPAAPLTDELLRQLLNGVAGVNDDAGAIEAVYRMADPATVAILPGVDGDGAGAE